MRWSSLVLAAMAVALTTAAPAAQPDPQPAPQPDPRPDPQPDPLGDNTPEIIEIIAPAASAQETLSTLNLGAPGAELSERNKRTIGILRQLFPTLTQIIEQKVQQITSSVLQTFGPVVLRAFLGNRGGDGGNTGGGGGGGSIELDDDDDDDEDEATTVRPTTTAGPARRRRYVLLPGGVADENQLLSGAESQQAEVRVAFGGDQPAPDAAAGDQAAAASNDQAAAASDDQAAAANSASIDEISLDDADASEENRNKRFLSFGGSSGGSSGGGGSGNFLFDIVRRPAEAMARAAGGAWRLFAGTDSLRLGLSAEHTATLPDAQLVAGSSSASGGAEGEAAAEGEAGKADGLTEGVPGPITRLFIIANRGIANLVQDLILRIAQTSERIVNFKARLITSII